MNRSSRLPLGHKSDGWYLITPKTAQVLLNKRKKNRSMTKTKVQALVRIMREGRWQPNGESIIFDGTGCLIDGQHRLTACVNSKMDIASYVVHLSPGNNDSKQVFSTIDTGKSRSGSDRLSIEGVKNPALVASTIRRVLRYESNWERGGGYIGNDVILGLYEQRSRVYDDACAFTQTYSKDIAGWLQISALSFIVCSQWEASRLKAELFCARVATGADSPRGSSIYNLRRTLMNTAMKHDAKLSSDTIQRMLVLTWNDFCSGSNRSTFRKIGTMEVKFR